MLRYVNLFLFVITSFSSLNSQKKAEIEFEDLKKRFPTESEIILDQNEIYTFSIKKGKLHVVKESYIETIVLSAQAINNGDETLYETELMPLLSYDAYTITPKGKKVTFDAVKEGRGNSNVFYDDLKQYKIGFNGLEVGSKKIIKSKHEFKDAHFLLPFSFEKYIPALSLSITLDVESGIDVNHLLYNPNDAIQISKNEKRNNTLFSWKRQNVEAIKLDDRSPGYLYTTPHLIFYIKSYQNGKFNVPMLGNTDKLFNYYRGFVKKLNKSEDPELKKIAQDLVSDLGSDEEKIKAILYWVKDHIKYIAYEDGYGGFIPREASLVNSRKFGDCKDMSSIITSMANYADLDSVCLVWVGTRRLPYTYVDVPTPLVDDHMIAGFVNEGKVVFLDATDRYSSYGLPSSFIQGKEAMVRTGEDSYELVYVPIVPDSVNMRTDTLNIKIEDSKLIGTGKMQTNGLLKTKYVSRISEDDETRRFKDLKSILILGNNKFNVDDIHDQNTFNRESPMVIDYDFDIDNYIVQLQNEIYINPFLTTYSDLDKTLPNRISPIDFDITYQHNLYMNLEIPNGYKVNSIPKSSQISNKFFDFLYDFSVEDNNIILDYKLSRKVLTINTSEFEEWDKCIEDIKDIFKQNIQLIK